LADELRDGLPLAATLDTFIADDEPLGCVADGRDSVFVHDDFG
jgi:hypothetical protein